MAKTKSKKPVSVNQQKTFSVSDWIPFLLEETAMLSLRMDKCISALNTYDAMPSDYEIRELALSKMDEIINTMRQKYGTVNRSRELDDLIDEHILKEYDNSWNDPRLDAFIDKYVLTKYDEFPRDYELVKLIIVDILKDDTLFNKPELVDEIAMPIMMNLMKRKFGDTINLDLNEFVKECGLQEGAEIFNDPTMIAKIDHKLDLLKFKLMYKYDINTMKIFEYVNELIGKSNVCEQQSLMMLKTACVTLGTSADERKKMNDKEKYGFVLLEGRLRSKANEAIGYWTAKLEMMKQNKANVKPRTTKKEKHKEELKEWMKTMSKKECRLKAQKEFDVTDRAVLNYLKEIKAEETAFLRKKDDTA